MTTTRRAARSLGGMIAQPPITKEQTEAALGREISPEAWNEIERAFARHGGILDDLAASESSQKKDDPQSWHSRQAATAKALEAALTLAQRARDRHGRFLDEASDNYSLRNHGYSLTSEEQAHTLVNIACQNLLNALVIVERAEPLDIDVPTAATARDDLVRAVADALTGDSIEVETSAGWHLEALDRPVRLSDLAAFEQLVATLGIGDDKKPAAFAAWVRSALAGRKRG